MPWVPLPGPGLSNYLAWLSSNHNICLESWNRYTQSSLSSNQSQAIISSVQSESSKVPNLICLRYQAIHAVSGILMNYKTPKLIFKTIQRIVGFSMGEKLKYVTHCESLAITLENWSKLSPALSNWYLCLSSSVCPMLAPLISISRFVQTSLAPGASADVGTPGDTS